MKIGNVPKPVRQQKLQANLESNPFFTDEELANQYNVSVQTIRLDRMELGIPELRKRLKQMAETNYDQVRSLSINEVIGEMVDLNLEDRAISIFAVGEDHVFSKTKICRGHHIFAQANSLAVAVMDAEVALTAAARVRFIRPVQLGERLVAKAVAQRKKEAQFKVAVETKVKEEVVFDALFRVSKLDESQKQP